MSSPLDDTLNDLLAPVLTGDYAQRVMSFELGPAARERLEYLRHAANDGALTDEERAEYERFVEKMDFVALLRAEARLATRKAL